MRAVCIRSKLEHNKDYLLYVLFYDLSFDDPQLRASSILISEERLGLCKKYVGASTVSISRAANLFARTAESTLTILKGLCVAFGVISDLRLQCPRQRYSGARLPPSLRSC